MKTFRDIKIDDILYIISDSSSIEKGKEKSIEKIVVESIKKSESGKEILFNQNRNYNNDYYYTLMLPIESMEESDFIYKHNHVTTDMSLAVAAIKELAIKRIRMYEADIEVANKNIIELRKTHFQILNSK